MYTNTKIGIRALWIISISVLFFSSCVPLKKQVYLQNQLAADSTKNEYVNDNTPSYTLQTGNNLYIQVVSMESDLSDFFNGGVGSGGNIYYDAAIYLSSYSVNDEGYVELPFLGKIFVQGLNLEQAKEKIQKEVDSYIEGTMIIVKLVNYNVSVIGQVRHPGQFKIYQDHINIFEVLSLAGDLTTFAKRDDVVLVRKTEKGTSVHHINLMNDEILESEYFYILPDDIIYVQPVKGKNFAFETFPYTLVISSISLAIALFALLK